MRALANTNTNDFTQANESISVNGPDQFLDSIEMAIEESEKLGWDELAAVLKQFAQSRPDSLNEEWGAIYQALNKIESEIILMDWEWEVTDVEDVERLIDWLEGHELIFSCLDRVLLEELDRKDFEDEYLYRLPPHARSS